MNSKEEAFNEMVAFNKPGRLRPSSRGSQQILVETESDKGRVINSAAFRRLQQKAQVFPLDTNASVRTRLTHSIEVSQIGRFLAQKVIEKCSGLDGSYGKLAAFANTIETACLLHDIGNPPFGHFGEAAIRLWAKDSTRQVDLLEYDGNPQGFRQITFLNGTDQFGLNLTCSLILSTVKYPWDHRTKPNDAHKVGLFSTDYETYENACQAIGWTEGKKFPFAILMEAADDIAYSMSDLEDGLEKGIIAISDLREEFGYLHVPNDDKAKIDPFIDFKTKTIRETVDEASTIFVENIDRILLGDPVDLISKTNPCGALIRKVKRFARQRIYSDEAAEKIELAGRSVIGGLLNHFEPLIKTGDVQFGALTKNDIDAIKEYHLDIESRLFRRLPRSYVDHYLMSRGAADEVVRRAHLLVDFVSNMTDYFALELYQILQGIRLK